MKLLKLVYIAHGWHLGIKGTSLITEVVQAWKYGPVIPTVYNAVKKYGNGLVTSMLDTKFDKDIDHSTSNLLDKVWEVYKDHDGLQLSTITHTTGTPWYTTWHEKGGKDSFSIPIANNLIKAHYEAKIQANQPVNNA